MIFRLLLPPDVTLRSPNGGEKAFVGSPWTIRWDVVRATSIDVEFSTNGGASYAPIPECTGLAGSATSCAWTPAGPATTNARVRVIAHGAAGETATDASDASFAISTEVPTLAVTTPNTAVTWLVGSTQQLKWSHNVGANALVQTAVSRDGGGSWAPVAPPVRNTSAKSGTFLWTVTGPATSTALVRVSWLDGPLADVSNVPFIIRQPTVTVTSPTSAGSWAIGGTRAITWTHDIPAGGRVNLDVSRDGGAGWSSIAAGVANATSRSGAYNWIVTGPVTAAARIRVTWELDPAVSDASNVDFAIVEPLITISSPNTAVKWRVANTQTLKFDHNLGPGQAVSLELTRDGGATWEPLTVVTTAAGTSTSYSWSVTGPPTSNARVRARWAGNPAVFDDSNVSFTILPRVTVTAPNKNVAWTIGSTQSITWAHNVGISEAVNIDLSRDGGATWESIATGVPNTSATSGAFSWVVTGPPTTLAVVRVGWPADPAASDVSNVAFRIQ